MKLNYQIYKLNLKETFSISYGNYSFREALIVTLSSNEISGYGECTAIDYYKIDLQSYLKILNENQSRIENQKIVSPQEFYNFLSTLQLPNFLKSALDCAYWDLFGKLERKPFFELTANTASSSIPESSLTISIASIKTQIEKIKKSKWSKFKVKCNHFSEADLIELSNLNIPIAIDSNASFKIANCNRIASLEIATNFQYFEQPMQTGFENYKYLNVNSYPNWMADEDLQDVSQLKNLQNHYQSVNIKLMKCGGLTPALHLIQEAKKLNFKIMIGCMTESTIGISAGAVLAPMADFVDLDGANLIANDIANGTKIKNGIIEFSEKHGLGIELK
ncbi:MAG: chloromuconate cycloisomerase [Flavobacterium sp.]|nr:chloromuconate cycloisomerase [Flavobacterium sp.]